MYLTKYKSLQRRNFKAILRQLAASPKKGPWPLNFSTNFKL